jgi:hypothetical protein
MIEAWSQMAPQIVDDRPVQTVVDGLDEAVEQDVSKTSNE